MGSSAVICSLGEQSQMFFLSGAIFLSNISRRRWWTYKGDELVGWHPDPLGCVRYCALFQGVRGIT